MYLKKIITGKFNSRFIKAFAYEPIKYIFDDGVYKKEIMLLNLRQRQ